MKDGLWHTDKKLKPTRDLYPYLIVHGGCIKNGHKEFSLGLLKSVVDYRGIKTYEISDADLLLPKEFVS